MWRFTPLRLSPAPERGLADVGPLGKPGYNELSAKLKARAAHADTLTRYYDQTVNNQFAELIRRVGNDPTKAQVRAVLRQINEVPEFGVGLGCVAAAEDH